MTNRITLLIILISIILLSFATTQGIKIGNFQILSIAELIEKNDELNATIAEASELTTKNYPSNIEQFEETYKQYEIQKQKYEELIGMTSEIDQEIYETKQYDIGYLWRVLGNYAKNRNVNLGIEAKKIKVGENVTYNLNFNIEGRYVDISQFITDIENDSDLYFRIYSFNIVPRELTEKEKKELSETEKQKLKNHVIATFTIRNVNLDAETVL